MSDCYFNLGGCSRSGHVRKEDLTVKCEHKNFVCELNINKLFSGFILAWTFLFIKCEFLMSLFDSFDRVPSQQSLS